MNHSAPAEWSALSSIDTLDEIISDSHQGPILIFKHSTRCPISTIAKLKLEDQWHDHQRRHTIYFLDLIQYRSISDEISRRFAVHHESPQLLTIHQGECILDSSHLAIDLAEVVEVLT